MTAIQRLEFPGDRGGYAEIQLTRVERIADVERSMLVACGGNHGIVPHHSLNDLATDRVKQNLAMAPVIHVIRHVYRTQRLAQ